MAAASRRELRRFGPGCLTLSFSSFADRLGEHPHRPTISTATIMMKAEKPWRIGEPLQKASTPATISTITERAAFTSLGTADDAKFLVGADRHGGGLIGQSRLAAQVFLQKPRFVTVEQGANESAIEIRRAEQPIGHGKVKFMLTSIISRAL